MTVSIICISRSHSKHVSPWLSLPFHFSSFFSPKSSFTETKSGTEMKACCNSVFMDTQESGIKAVRGLTFSCKR